MNYEEASALAKAILEGAPKLSRKNGKNNFDWMMFEFYAIVIEALEKQIPKNLATNGENFGGMPYKFCPSCGHCMGLKPNASHCPECGQAVDCSEMER